MVVTIINIERSRHSDIYQKNCQPKPVCSRDTEALVKKYQGSLKPKPAGKPKAVGLKSLMLKKALYRYILASIDVE
jgi:ParB family chromosome partitioning protein